MVSIGDTFYWVYELPSVAGELPEIGIGEATVKTIGRRLAVFSQWSYPFKHFSHISRLEKSARTRESALARYIVEQNLVSAAASARAAAAEELLGE
jgi:hypothetical protein